MRSYKDITYRYIKQNSRRTIFTIIGIILSLSLISGIGFLGFSFKDFLIENAKANGDYEFYIYEVNKEQIDILKNDVDLYNVAVIQSVGGFKFQSEKESDIYLEAYDENSLKNVFKINLTEGDYPKNSIEIIIDSRVKEDFDVKLGEEVTLDMLKLDDTEVKKTEEKVFKVVGFFKVSYSTGTSYSSITCLDKSSAENANIFFSLKDKKDKIKIAQDKAERLGISSDNVLYNNDLLTLTGEGSMSGINLVFTNAVIIVISIVCLSTIFLIYNAINISVAERMNQFAILRSIGATPKQIRNLVLREGVFMCLVSVPFGVVFGFLGVDITTKLLKNQIMTLLGEVAFNVKFYPATILLTLILGLITILLACYGPARSAGNVSPITVLRSNGTVSGEKIKYYKATLIKKIFGVEGWIAYKNIRRNSKRFAVTIISLSISLIMFSVFTTINIKRLEDMDYVNKTSISQGTLYVRKDNYKEIEKELKDIKDIEYIYKVGEISPRIPIEKSKITEEFKNIFSEDLYEFDLKDYIVEASTNIKAYNNEALKVIGEDDVLKEDEIIIINNRGKYNSDGKLENVPITNINEGDTFNIPKAALDKIPDDYAEGDLSNVIKKDIENKNFYTFKVKKIIDKDIFLGDYNYNLSFIINEELFYSLEHSTYTNENLYLRFKRNIDNPKIEDALEKVQKIADKYGVSFYNLYGENKSEEERWLVINVFIYGFIVMITLIGVVNVINTISLNILLKKKEFASLGTIGMSKNQLSKMIILEGALHGIISSVVGSIISTGLIFLLIKVISRGFSVSDKIPLFPLSIGIIGIMTITLLSAMLPLRKINKISLVDGIRSEE